VPNGIRSVLDPRNSALFKQIEVGNSDADAGLLSWPAVHAQGETCLMTAKHKIPANEQ
jgi:hypothetical protein